MQPWPGNRKAAALILEFFGIIYSTRDHHGMLILEGEYGNKLLSLLLGSNPDSGFAIQFRAKDTHRNMGGAILNGCMAIGFFIEPKHMKVSEEGQERLVDFKSVTIRSFGGEIFISSDGINATIL